MQDVWRNGAKDVHVGKVLPDDIIESSDYLPHTSYILSSSLNTVRALLIVLLSSILID